MITSSGVVIESVRKMHGGVQRAFSSVKAEMDEHLDSINQNTNEIQSCYEYLAELDAKLDKMTERLDELQFALMPETRFEHLEHASLSSREQEVFLLLYAHEEPLTSLVVARRLGLTVEMVERYLASLLAKGVPILKSFVDGSVFHTLDLKFKALQARRNVLRINESVSAQLLHDKAI